MSEYGKMIVPIEGGEHECAECGGLIVSQSDEPVVFECEGCGNAHIWHRRCLPPELEALVKQIDEDEERLRKAEMN